MQSRLEIEEYDLLIALRNGDQQALAKLMETYKRMLAKRILYILKSKEDTEEVLQELFVRVWRNRQKIDPGLPVKAYLFHIGENLVFDSIRKASREKRLVANYKDSQVNDSYNPVEEYLYRKENRALIEQIMAKVPEQSRKVFTLCKLEGRSYQEVSELLSISQATVNSHITKANQLLRTYLKDHPHITLLFISFVFSSMK